MKRIVLLLLFAAAVAHATAPQYVNVTASACLVDASGSLLERGTLKAYAVDGNGNPLALSTGSLIGLNEPIVRPISAGSLGSTLQLIDPLAASPLDFGYTFVIVDPTHPNNPTIFAKVPVGPDGSGNFNLCGLNASDYTAASPIYPPLFLSTTGSSCSAATLSGSTLNIPPCSPTGGGLSWRGAFAASTAYNAGDIVSEAGSSYEAIEGFNSGASFDPTDWNLLAAAGATGATGATGAAGATGATGPQGPQGAQGPAGATGAQGPQGTQGATGATGAQGPQGTQGATGATGAQGPQGTQGATGAAGATGATGAAGAAGQGFNFRGAWAATTAYAAYDVVTNGGNTYVVTTGFTSGASFATTNLALMAQAGATGATGAAGATGATGAQGAQGTTGAAGATGATGAAGQGFNFRSAWAATTAYAAYDVVTNGGNTYVVTTGFTSGASFATTNLALMAQAGATGATGATGAQGIQGATGAAGATGATGAAGATAPTASFPPARTPPAAERRRPAHPRPPWRSLRAPA
jgi:hypothetical protein